MFFQAMRIKQHKEAEVAAVEAMRRRQQIPEWANQYQQVRERILLFRESILMG
jgi:hypothetical protein